MNMKEQEELKRQEDLQMTSERLKQANAVKALELLLKIQERNKVSSVSPATPRRN